MRRHIVIGDIHGCIVELSQLLDQIGPGEGDTIVSVGDLVDRGPESVEVLDFFRSRPDTITLMGNHERKHVRGVFSYGQEITRAQFARRYAGAVEWMRGLPYYLELEEAIVVHAAVAPGVPLHQQRDEILCGSTAGEKQLQALTQGRWWHELYDGAKPVIFGHHVVGDQPLIERDKIYGIDTGACHGGRLTAITLPDFRIHSVPSREDHWKRVQRDWQVPVLAGRPWLQSQWKEIDTEILHHAKAEDERTRRYAAALAAWREAQSGLSERLYELIQSEAARLEREGGASGRDQLARAHPLGKFLFQCFKGRLSLETLRTQCYTPEKLIEVAKPMGLEIPALPEAR